MNQYLNKKYESEIIKLKKIINNIYFKVTGHKNVIKKECYPEFYYDEYHIDISQMTESVVGSFYLDDYFLNKKSLNKIISLLKKYLSNKKCRFEFKVIGCYYIPGNNKNSQVLDSIFSKEIPAYIQVLVKNKHKFCIKSPYKKSFLFFDHETAYEMPSKKDLKEKKNCIKFENTYGFDPTEVWSLYHCVAVFVLPRLIKLKEVKYKGLLCKNPNELSIEKGYYTEEETENIYNKMIDSFKWAALEYDSQDTGILLTKERMREIKEGFELFGKHFLELCD